MSNMYSSMNYGMGGPNPYADAPSNPPYRTDTSGTSYGGYESRPILSNVTSAQPDGPQIPARLFQKIENLRPNEVPPDGTLALFVPMDLKYVIVKQVNQRGTIDELRYFPEIKEEEKSDQAPAIQAEMYAMLQDLMKKVDGIEKKVNRPYQKSNYHKPVQNGTTQQKATTEGGNNS